MNRIYFLLLLCYAAIAEASIEDSIKIDSIVVKQVSWSMVTSTVTTCQDFEEIFPECNEYHIKDGADISCLYKEMGNLKKSNGKIIDVRCKMYVYVSNRVLKTICVDQHDVLYDGFLYQVNQQFLQLLNDMTTKYARVDKMDMIQTKTERDIPFPNGMDSLRTYLSQQSEVFFRYVDESVSLEVLCFVDAQGNTSKVRIFDNAPKGSPKNLEELKTILTDIFLKDIKWLPDKERFPYESVWIPIKVEMPTKRNRILR